jgi:hypothetical protein
VHTTKNQPNKPLRSSSTYASSESCSKGRSAFGTAFRWLFVVCHCCFLPLAARLFVVLSPPPPPWLSLCFFLVRCGCSVLFGFVLYIFYISCSVSFIGFNQCLPRSTILRLSYGPVIVRVSLVLSDRLSAAHAHAHRASLALARGMGGGGGGWGWGMGMGRARGGVARCTWVLGPCALCLGPNSPTGCAYGPLKPARAGYGLGRQRLGLRTRTRVLK